MQEFLSVFFKIDKNNKMIPLKSNQKVLKWLCGLPPERNSTKASKLAYIAFTLSVISGLLIPLIASGTYIWRNILDNIEDALFCVFHHIGGTSILYQCIAIVLLRHKLIVIFEQLSKIYDESENEKYIVMNFCNFHKASLR